MYDKLIDLLNNIRPDIDFEKEKRLLTDEILDSYDMISIVAAIMENFDIEIPVEFISEEHFDSVDTIQSMLENLKE